MAKQDKTKNELSSVSSTKNSKAKKLTTKNSATATADKPNQNTSAERSVKPKQKSSAANGDADIKNNMADKNNRSFKKDVADKAVVYTIDKKTGDVEVSTAELGDVETSTTDVSGVEASAVNRTVDLNTDAADDKINSAQESTKISGEVPASDEPSASESAEASDEVQTNADVETSDKMATKKKAGHKKGTEAQTTVKPNKKKKLLRRLLTFGIIIVLGVVSGAFLADWYKNYLKSQIADYTSYAITDYIDDTRAIVAKATGIENPSDDDLNNFASLAKQHGKTPLDYTPSENYALAYFKASLATSYSAIGTGQVSTPVANQSVYSAKKFDGNKYTFESVSLGMLTVAKCIVSNSGSGKVTVIDGNNANTSGATWNGNSVDYTDDEFRDLAGVLPSELIPYIISSKTILNEDQVEISKTDFNGKEVYKFTVELNNVYSVLFYHKQVKFSSGFSDSPSFSNIKITFLMDDEWNFVQTQIEEKYTVIFGISVQCTGTLVTDYTFNQTVEMPL